jgi:hypothetical protein
MVHSAAIWSLVPQPRYKAERAVRIAAECAHASWTCPTSNRHVRIAAIRTCQTPEDVTVTRCHALSPPPDLCCSSCTGSARFPRAMHPTSGRPPLQTENSTLRPRTRRLISIDDELATVSSSETGSSQFRSRNASPIPSSHPSRSTITSNPSAFVRSASAQAPKAFRDTSAALSGIWGSSWSAIQGLATNVLGNEAVPDDAAARRRRPLFATHRRTTSSTRPKQWGPSSSADSPIGMGSQEERESLVRAMKRRDLLTASEHMVSDSLGRMKRRNSDDRASASAPPGDNDERDALVYIHAVRPQDTLAGISIKYSCEPAVLRKANRMWPNDSVQTKTTLVLPVDACGVKGRPVAGPNDDGEEFLSLGGPGDSSTKSEAGLSTSSNGWDAPVAQNTETPLIPSSSHSTANSEQHWIHDSWVLLPNETHPTQIGRLPRRSLGFFPPARRKSLTLSDATPSASLDLPRSSTSTNYTPQLSSPPRNSTKGRPSTRADSISGRNRSASNNFLLHGPGGVGTMNLNVRSPGPAQDGLNKLFAQHLPNVAPPPNQEYFTPWAPSLLSTDAGTSFQGGGSAALTPVAGAGIDLQEIGGAIENWVRKVGTQASKLLSEPSTPGQGKRSAVPVIGAVGGDLGDLIELRDDAFEIGEGDESRGRSRGSETLLSPAEKYPSARPDINLVMRDRGRGGGESSKAD